MPNPRLVAVVDDDLEFHAIFAARLRAETESGLARLLFFASAAELLANLPAEEFTLLTDLHLPETSGTDLVLALRARGRRDLRAYLMSGDEDLSDALASSELALAGAFTKPIDFARLKAALLP